MRKKYLSHLLFFVVLLADLFALHTQNKALEIAMKPLIVFSLVLIYWQQSEKKERLFLLALVFSWLGDTFLLDKNIGFIPGLGSFLIAHLMYVLLFAKKLRPLSKPHLAIGLLLYGLYAFGFVNFIQAGLGDMLIPVCLYAAAIGLFGAVALMTFLKMKNALGLLLWLGATLFIGSDSMIALNMFHKPEPYYPMAIMVTYALAQYLILNFQLAVERRED